MISLLINAGGKSERMKRDFPDIISKCWLEIDGKPVIMRNILELQSLVDEILIILKDKSMVESFDNKFKTQKDFNLVRDRIRFAIDDSLEFLNDHGPMLSIKTGIKNAKNDTIVSIPSDMPFLDKNIVELMLKKLVNGTVISVKTESYFNTLLFVAHKEDLISISEFIWKRVTDIYRLFPNILIMGIPDSFANYFMGINTKQDYDLTQELALEYRYNQTNWLNAEIKFITRNLDLQEAIINFDVKSEKELFEDKCYYLLINLYKEHKITQMYKIDFLLSLENDLWKPISEIIAKHCKIDLEKLAISKGFT